MSKCELCSYPARIYCESDQARLCWDCDEKVHAANFLVERHSRCLLCHVCEAPTPWMASGLKLPRTVSVCVSCVGKCDRDGNEKVVEDEREHQVVPLTMCTPPPPMEESSSSSGGEFTSRSLAKKRKRVDVDLDSDDDIHCHSSQSSYTRISTTLTLRAPGDNEASDFNQLKKPRTTEERQPVKFEENHVKTKLDSNAIMCSLKRFQQSSISGSNMAETIHGFRKLSRDPRSLDLDLH